MAAKRQIPPMHLSPRVYQAHVTKDAHNLPCPFLATASFLTPCILCSLFVFHHTPRGGGCNIFKLVRDIMIFVRRKIPEKRITVFGILRGVENSTIFIDFHCLRLSFLLYSNQMRNLVTQSVFVTQSLAWDCSVEWLRQSQRGPELLVCSSAVKIFKWKRKTIFFFSVFERIFVEWKDGTLSFDVNIQLLQTDPHTIS